MKKPEEIKLEDDLLGNNEVYIMPETSLFAQIASWVIGVITLVVILAGIIYALYRIYKLFYSKVVIMDDVRREKITSFIKDSKKTEKTTSIRRRIRTMFDNSNNLKIRRLFVRAVQRNTQSDHVLKYKLPKELSEYALVTGKPSMDELAIHNKRAELTSIYEKARYSKEECSKEEVRLVKNILK
jgi:hypothetical protein